MSSAPPLVSVVTPVYNGERFLRECIESVLAQTYPHWDYTILNNCSSDGTRAIALEYAARDSRIRVHDNARHLRVLENYNTALRQISPGSKYCKPLAADDCLFAECLERMVALAEREPNVAIVGSYGLGGQTAERVVWGGLPYRADGAIGRGREACRLRLLGGPYVFGTPSTVLLRADLVRSRPAFYNESNLHADSEACLELLGEYDFGFVHQVLSFRRDRAESLTAFSQRFNTYLPGILEELMKYGRRYLRDDEWRARIREVLRDYYRYLGEQVYRGREKEFWRFHRNKLAALGHPLSKARLALAALSYAGDLALNPKSTVERVVSRLRRNGADHSAGS